MTSDDEFFFDYVSLTETNSTTFEVQEGSQLQKLSWIPNDVKRYSTQVAQSIDRHVDRAATNVRDALSRQSWLPAYLRPPPRPSPSLLHQEPPTSMVSRIHDWVLEHRAWTAAILAFVGTGGLLIYGNRRLRAKKRKARRAGNGARKEIVVIAGSAHEAVTRSIASDLERRGFIVFITVASVEEQNVVENEAREDIRSLWFDPADVGLPGSPLVEGEKLTGTQTPSEPSKIHPSVYAIHSLITNPQAPMPGVPPHTCQLTGVILIPSLKYPVGPVATIPASNWADVINTRLLYPILTAQLFLPLLTTKNNSSSIILITPSIQSSLSSPFASPEVAVVRALSGFANSLRQELLLLAKGRGSVEVVELKLGNIDFGRQFRNISGQSKGTEVLTWQPQQRALYSSPYLSSIDHRLGRPAGNGAPHGTPARELYFAIFDALAPRQKSIFGLPKRKPQVVYVGRGSRAYAIAGNVLPNMMIGWMLGLRTGYPAFVADSGSDDGNGYGSDAAWERVP
ncbi:hypothetical protein PRK78_004265 [Emydomyces testavorans]|uniref:DUF1776-domain-containing protein n=1 Tax=Emydomyces testavorans TaxID=2070801 RepID=A0AAF0IJD6_9EURO|nr:hypothetical protein PRK78_004265 [Emydomyces testavorans]